MFNAYRTVGIVLPRNADQQELTAGTKKKLSGSSQERAAVISKLMPGAALYMDGHCLMYIGNINQTPYTIHALGSYFSKGRLMREMKVLVSDLSLQRSSGNNMLNELQTAIEYK